MQCIYGYGIAFLCFVLVMGQNNALPFCKLTDIVRFLVDYLVLFSELKTVAFATQNAHLTGRATQ